mmetsp:Transcript_26928/g.86534  ORF Transcript_26928/g.86534 Transcript_26928/m.86534 type:complete len:217 (+) Transcript_26928:113-763(+)
MGCGQSTPTDKKQGAAAPASGSTAMAGSGAKFDAEMGKKLHSAIRWDKPLDEIKALMPSAEAANFEDDRNGNCPLHIASQNGHLHIVKIVIAAGGDVNKQNKGGQTPMHMAVAYDYDEVTAFLSKSGADPMIKNEAGFAAQNGIDGDRGPGGKKKPMDLLKDAQSSDELIAAFDAILEEKPDKAEVVQAGLKVKKEKKDFWSADVNAKFQQCISDL